MKKLVILLIIAVFAFSGCSGKKEGAATVKDKDISFNNEKVVKEIKGAANVFKRYEDKLFLTAENGDTLESYSVDIVKGQVAVIENIIQDDQFTFYEAAGDGGFISVQNVDQQSILKFKDKSGKVKDIATNIGNSDGVNVSISPSGKKVAYTAQIVGSSSYGLYIFDTASQKSHILMDRVPGDFVSGFGYMVNWSPEEENVIISDKYIFSTVSGSKKGELQSAFTEWSSSGRYIAFISEENGAWLSTEDSDVYAGKTVCIYDTKTGDFRQIFTLPEGEYILGDICWSENENKIAFSGVSIKDKNDKQWYAKLIYNAVYIVNVKDGNPKRLETKVDISLLKDTELSNFKFSKAGGILSFTIGSFEKSTLHIINSETMKEKIYENAEYLHWMDGENYVIPVANDMFYFCNNNSVLRIDSTLQEKSKYKSKTKLDDFYISKDNTSMIIIEQQNNTGLIRYLSK